ncbi:Mut7-C RNAse domain-containing protein, partial [Methanoregula sp.]|uniref:Mut7-C RNAse domain-containing protein n=1 Tax=Methanoregula sp. TaxID=2052170 RepID=UPI003C715C42
MPPETRFIADRMLGTLTRYLRFMGYDTISANGFRSGNANEDSQLLTLALNEHRILLTRDHELARRGQDQAVLVTDGDIL